MQCATRLAPGLQDFCCFHPYAGEVREYLSVQQWYKQKLDQMKAAQWRAAEQALPRLPAPVRAEEGLAKLCGLTNVRWLAARYHHSITKGPAHADANGAAQFSKRRMVSHRPEWMMATLGGPRMIVRTTATWSRRGRHDVRGRPVPTVRAV
ncbi:hypothetical protein GCM10017687_26490 [Streptomyces echinatus]